MAKKTVTVTVEKETWERFKTVAKANNRNASQLFRDYIKDYLSKNAQTKIEF